MVGWHPRAVVRITVPLLSASMPSVKAAKVFNQRNYKVHSRIRKHTFCLKIYISVEAEDAKRVALEAQINELSEAIEMTERDEELIKSVSFHLPL